METKAEQSKDGSFDIPDELSEAYLLDCGLSFVDIRLAPRHVIHEFLTLQHIKGVANKAQKRKAENNT